MFGLGPAELLILGVLALLFIGPKKLPELARGLGKSLREFQKAKNDFSEEFNTELNAKPKIENPPAVTNLADQQNPETPEKKS